MSRAAHEGRFTSIHKENDRWSPMEDYVLESLVGKVTYQMIALRLGRSAGAVQRRASYKGYSAHANRRGDKAVRKAQLAAITEARLTASAEELAAFL